MDREILKLQKEIFNLTYYLNKNMEKLSEELRKSYYNKLKDIERNVSLLPNIWKELVETKYLLKNGEEVKWKRTKEKHS